MDDLHAVIDGGLGQEFERLATQALSVVMSRGLQTNTQINGMFVAALIAGALSPRPSQLAETIRDLRGQKVSDEALTDLYIPEAARQLGRDWLDDSRSFMDVSIGTAKLQSEVRAISRRWIADSGMTGSRGTVLVAVPQQESHTLGAVVLASQLRRAGVSVCLRVNASTEDLAGVVRTGSYDAIMISWGRYEGLDVPRKLVETLRRASKGSVPITVGGSVLDGAKDVREATGADFATNDIDVALTVCGVQRDIHRAIERA